jgi:hypothetical protein
MIDDQTFYARIRRNRNWADAGEILMFPPNIPDIECLNDKNILLLLYRDKDCWTAISRTSLYYHSHGSSGCIDINHAGVMIHNYLFGRNDKDARTEFIPLGNGEFVWVVNAQICCGIENAILALESGA